MARTRTTVTPTTTTGRKPGLLSRLAGKKTTQNARVTESTSRNPITGTTTTRSKGVHTTQHRKPSMGDKISGGLMNLKGSLTGKPGVKVSCSTSEMKPETY